MCVYCLLQEELKNHCIVVVVVVVVVVARYGRSSALRRLVLFVDADELVEARAMILVLDSVEERAHLAAHKHLEKSTRAHRDPQLDAASSTQQ